MLYLKAPEERDGSAGLPNDDYMGLLVTLTMIGAIVGGVVVAVMIQVNSSRQERAVRLRDAAARWLAARIGVQRAAIALVSAHRALNREVKYSPHFSLRQDEVLRSRHHWYEAMNDLDLAQSMLMVWCSHESSASLVKLDHVGADAMRMAMEGADNEVEPFLEQMTERERHISEAIREMIEQEMMPVFVWRLRQWARYALATLRR